MDNYFKVFALHSPCCIHMEKRRRIGLSVFLFTFYQFLFILCFLPTSNFAQELMNNTITVPFNSHFMV